MALNKLPLSGRLTRIFLWLSVVGGGFLLGAKVFDTVVLAGAWNHAVPDSLRYLPYGQDFPVDTGTFFIPVSALLLVSNFGAAIAGWRTPWSYRAFLVVPALGIFLTLLVTVAIFWPMNQALWDFAHHRERVPHMSAADAVGMGRRWVTLDWCRIAMVALSLLASLRAFGQPYPQETAPQDPLWVKVGLGLFLLLVIAFVVYFIGNI